MALARSYLSDGAAGLLLLAHRPRPSVLMIRRSWMVTYPLTWSMPAGALEPGEPAVDGALREAEEELGSLPDLELEETIVDAVSSHWSFHIVVATTPRARAIRADGVDAWEIDDVAWVDLEDVQDLDLHPRLRSFWPTVLARLEAIL